LIANPAATVGSTFDFIRNAILDTWRCLSHERSRALSLPSAVLAWASGQAQRWKRLRRLGWKPYSQLLQAEALAAPVGLSYSREDDGQQAPWHLPERFLCLAVAQLPAHPVIDGAFLEQWAGSQRQVRKAVPELIRLMQEAPVEAFWRELQPAATGVSLPPPARIAVCLHLFYPELWPGLHAELQQIPESWDLILSVPSFAATDVWKAVVRDHPRVRFVPSPNRGRDVAPFLTCLRNGYFDGYEAVCKLHGKRSPHRSGGDAWRIALLKELIGSAVNVRAVLHQFRSNPKLGMVGPAGSCIALGQAAGWAKNQRSVYQWSRRLRLGQISGQETFFAGTMFWFTPRALDALRMLDLGLRDFPIEMAQTEGTPAHALERLLAIVPRRAGFQVQSWSAQHSMRAAT
jgi:hypothetical protein